MSNGHQIKTYGSSALTLSSLSCDEGKTSQFNTQQGELAQLAERLLSMQDSEF
jgi:hypothetical protein